MLARVRLDALDEPALAAEHGHQANDRVAARVVPELRRDEAADAGFGGRVDECELRVAAESAAAEEGQDGVLALKSGGETGRRVVGLDNVYVGAGGL